MDPRSPLTGSSDACEHLNFNGHLLYEEACDSDRDTWAPGPRPVGFTFCTCARVGTGIREHADISDSGTDPPVAAHNQKPRTVHLRVYLVNFTDMKIVVCFFHCQGDWRRPEQYQWKPQWDSSCYHTDPEELHRVWQTERKRESKRAHGLKRGPE